MNWDDVGLYMRAFLIVGQVTVVSILAYEFIRNFKRLPYSIKLLKVGIVFISMYMIDAAREGIQKDVGFDVRLIPWLLGVFVFYLYIFMPESKRHSWTYAPDSDVS